MLVFLPLNVWREYLSYNGPQEAGSCMATVSDPQCPVISKIAGGLEAVMPHDQAGAW